MKSQTITSTMLKTRACRGARSFRLGEAPCIGGIIQRLAARNFITQALVCIAMTWCVLVGAPLNTQAHPLRDSDSLWISADGATGSPKLTQLTMSGGTTTTLYVWLRVEPALFYDVGGIQIPIFYDADRKSVV